jgi:hypothetical protein
MTFQSHNPATDKHIGTYPALLKNAGVLVGKPATRVHSHIRSGGIDIATPPELTLVVGVDRTSGQHLRLKSRGLRAPSLGIGEASKECRGAGT